MSWDKSVETEVSKKEEGEANTANSDIDYAKAHKEAQDELSKRAEAEIKANIKVAELSPKEILNMDKKMQNKVIKSLYGYENLEELKLIQWDNFYEENKEDDDEDDKVAAIEKELKIMKHKNSKAETNSAMEKFKMANAKLFKDNEDALEKIIEEMTYISDNLSPDERIARAAKIAFGNIVSSTDEAYLAMQDVSTGGSSTKSEKEEVKKNEDMEDAFSWVLAWVKKKEEFLKKFK